MYPSLIYAVASKEFRNSIRNRWVLAVSVILALLALSISYFGFAPRGETGFGGFEVTIVSLASLVTYLVPIIALTLGFEAIVGEVEGKTLELILTMPVSRLELFVGKFLGLSASLVVSTVFGFGFAGAVIAWQAGTAHAGSYLFFILTSVLLGLAFLSLALLISVVVKERSKAVGWVVFFWFFFVLIFDLLLIGVLVGTGGKINPTLFSALLYLNPTDVFRLMNLTSVESVRVTYGLATLTKGGLFSPSLLFAVMVLWIFAPLAGGYLIFNRRRY